MALTLLVGWQEGHPACKKTEWWCAGMVICLEGGADLHMVQLMTMPLSVSCFSKIQIGFTFLVPARPGSPGQRAIKRVSLSLSLSNGLSYFRCLATPWLHWVSLSFAENKLSNGESTCMVWMEEG